MEAVTDSPASKERAVISLISTYVAVSSDSTGQYGRHLVAPVLAAAVLGGHGVHPEAPADGANVPAGQGEHVPAPAALYVPASHSDCTLPAQEWPAGHTHSISHTLPHRLDGSTSSRLFAPQAVHKEVTRVSFVGSPSPLGLPVAHSPPALGHTLGRAWVGLGPPKSCIQTWGACLQWPYTVTTTSYELWTQL